MWFVLNMLTSYNVTTIFPPKLLWSEFRLLSKNSDNEVEEAQNVGFLITALYRRAILKCSLVRTFSSAGVRQNRFYRFYSSCIKWNLTDYGKLWMKMNAIIFLIPESNKWRLERPPTQWKRYFTRYLTKSGAPDIVPFLKKNISYGRPKTKRDERYMFFRGSARIQLGRAWLYLITSFSWILQRTSFSFA